MDTDENFDRSRILNYFAFFIESLSLYTQSLVKQNSYFCKKLMEDFQVAELFDAISDRISEYPPLKFLVFSVVLSCAVPIVMFIAFGITSIIVTFTGFLFVEGTLLVVGGLCVFICIITMILVLSILGIMLVVFYMLALKLKDILNIFETCSNPFQKQVSSGAPEPWT